MIISVRGTSGSGKSTVARAIMARYVACTTAIATEIMTPSRRKPIGYLMNYGGGTELRVLGHYAIANGGMDTVPLDLGYHLIERWACLGNVLYEGKTMRDTRARVTALARRHDVKIFFLTTEVDQCVERIQKRIGPTGKPHNIARRSVEAMADKCRRDQTAFTAAGLQCRSLPQGEVISAIERLLGLSSSA